MISSSSCFADVAGCDEAKQELEEIIDFLLRLIAAGDIGEGDLWGVSRQELRLGLPERKRPVATLLHLAQHEDDQPENEQVRQEAEQEDAERLFLLARPDVD